MGNEPTLSVSDQVSDEDLIRLRDGLDLTRGDLPPYRPMRLAVLLHDEGAGDDERGRLIGGLIGDTAWRWLSIHMLWVDPDYRGTGLGQRMMAAAEKEAAQRGCWNSRVDTFSFQAPGFYERCGYRCAMTLEDYPRSHRRHYYVKPLTARRPVAQEMPRRLRTERLLLRPFEQNDAEALARLNGNPDFMRHMGPVMASEDSWRQMAMLAGHWQLRGYGLWAVEHEGAMIGRIGLYYPEGWPDLEVGWALAPEVWGRGLATEGGRAALDQAVNVLGRSDPVSVIHPDNAASIRVAEKLGAGFERKMSLRGFEVVIYRHRHIGSAAD